MVEENVIFTKKGVFELEDAFPRKKEAMSAAKDLRSQGDKVKVRKLRPAQDSGRLKWGVFVKR